MKTETITQKILTAEDGMCLTNGDVVVTTVVLPEDADASVWQEITQEQAQEITKEDTEDV